VGRGARDAGMFARSDRIAIQDPPPAPPFQGGEKKDLKFRLILPLPIPENREQSMIEAVTAVARADAVAIAVAAGANARRTIEGRTRRLRWLDALRAANGEPLPLDEEERDAQILEDSRARIRAALETIDELHGFADEGDETLVEAPGPAVSAAAVAGLIRAGGHRALAAQAHFHAASICQILG